MKVADCGQGIWDDHGLDIPHELETFNFRVTGTGHERIEQIFCDCCADRRGLVRLNDKQPEQRIAAWIMPARVFVRDVRHEGSSHRDRF